MPKKSVDPFNFLCEQLDEMRRLVALRSWGELESKFRKLCAQMAGKKTADVIKAVSVKKYERALASAFSEAIRTALLNKYKRAYFEFDMDNSWGGYLEVGSKHKKCVDAPDFPAFARLYRNSFASTMKDAGRSAYLIARTYACLGRAVESIDAAGVQIGAAYHDQGEELIFAKGGKPDFGRFTPAQRKKLLNDEAKQRAEKMLKDLKPYLSTEEQREAIRAIARLDGRASPYGGSLEKSGGLDYVYLEGTHATDDDVELLRNFPTLDFITLDQTKITDKCLDVIAKIPHVTCLSLTDTSVSDAGIAKLSQMQLENLRLSYTRITAKGLHSLKKMKTLKSISIDGLGISKADRKALRAALPNVELFPPWIDEDTETFHKQLKAIHERIKNGEAVSLDDFPRPPRD